MVSADASARESTRPQRHPHPTLLLRVLMLALNFGKRKDGWHTRSFAVEMR